MGSLESLNEYVLFFSYSLISIIVLITYVRHARLLDTTMNRLLVITAGMFLMLCAITHLYSVFSPTKSMIISTSCSTVSFVSSICFLLSSRRLDDYLSLRITTQDAVRDSIVRDLSDGYDLRGFFCDNMMTEGVIKGVSITRPLEFNGTLENNSIIEINSNHYRLTKVMTTSVYLGSLEPDDYVEDPLVREYMVFGYDATAEVHMADEQERMNSMKMAICMSTAHDVRTPLSSLGIVISCLQSMGGKASERVQESEKLLEEAYVNVEMINLIITQFMEIGKLDSVTEVKPTISFIDMDVIHDRIKKVGTRLKGEKVEFSSSMSPGVPSSLLSDAEWVWQIILNLITNATKYTYDGYIRVEIDLRETTLEIKVTDTGIGIDDSQKKAVFEKFVTNKNFGHDSHGMGLYSVKMKIDALEGTIGVIDNPGGGSIFTVTIPVVLDNHTRSDSTDSDTSAGTTKTCLVIDDTPSIRKMMTRLLRKHHVETAVNGAEGLDMMKSKQYDLVLIDMFMPIMDGLVCITRFREWESANRQDRQLVYSMSANQHVLDERFDGALPKPIDGKRLNLLMERL